METIKIKSQPCTTPRQSHELVDLGVKKETGDMSFIDWDGRTLCSGSSYEGECSYKNTMLDYEVTPAWSLNRLISLCPESISHEGLIKDFCVNHRGAYYADEPHYCNTICFDSHENLYDNMIDCIAWLIKNNYFNKNYLEIR